MAALIVLAMSTYFFWQVTRPKAEVRLTYHEEVATPYETEKLRTNDYLEQDAQAYIKQLCQKATPATCRRPEFLALQAHLIELSEKEQELEKTMKQLGRDPQLIKYQVRIENMKADATKELLQMVIG